MSTTVGNPNGANHMQIIWRKKGVKFDNITVPRTCPNPSREPPNVVTRKRG
jgi:hypothetical protein